MVSEHRLTKIGKSHGSPVASGVSTNVRVVGLLTIRVPTPVRRCFYLLTFTLPFEATDLGFMTGSLSIAKLSGLLFFGCYVLYYSPLSEKRSLPPIPNSLWWFLGYIGMYVLSMQRVPPELFGDFLSRLLTLLQILVFFWIASDLLKDEKLARGVLLTYSFACALLAVGMVLGLPGFSQEVTGGRVSAIGENLNVLGKFIAIAMIQTGSRGAVAAFVIGTCVYLLPYYKTKRGMLAVILAICGLAGVVYMMVKSPDFLGRWQESYYEGKLSKRDKIFAATIEMNSDQPLYGWGPI